MSVPGQDNHYKIFISYRHEDSQAICDHLSDRLTQRFGAGSVFKDVTSIGAGYNFPDYVNHILGECLVALVLIGSSWAHIEARQGAYAGHPRLNHPEDYVRIEVEQALALAPADASGHPTGDHLLVPLLVEGARMPDDTQLPAALRLLTKRNATHLRKDPDFERDLQHLITIIAGWLGAHRSAPPQLGPAPTPANSQEATANLASLHALGFRRYRNTANDVEYILPPICPVRPTPPDDFTFTMGSDPKQDRHARNNEVPQFIVKVDAFAIGQYPVTVEEYACAVRAGAVREPPARIRLGTRTNWERQQKTPDHPVVGVSWNDAGAYTNWLAKITGQPWWLPTEAEWEKAARGIDGRIYPWGNDACDRKLCNVRESLLYRTNKVGEYPNSASPYQACDMAGNVWEWTSSLGMPYPYTIGDGREDPVAKGYRVLRGGSWFDNDHLARTACRVSAKPEHISAAVGFRLAWAGE